MGADSLGTARFFACAPLMKIELSRRQRLVAIVVVAVVAIGALALALTLRVAGARQKALQSKLEANVAAQREGPRKLDDAAQKRILAELDDVPGLTVEIGGVLGDAESLGLAADLHGLFQRAGYAMRPLAEYKASPEIPRGVAVYSAHVLDQVLSGGVAQLFRELGQANQWLEADPAAAADGQAAADPELKIIVGHRP